MWLHIFEGYVCKTFHEFLDGYNTDKDGFWFAEVNGVMVGAIAVVGRTPEKAQLRWFILHPDYRNLGLGGRLFASALTFCRQKDYRKAYLETTEEQLVAIAMYKKAGFVKVAEHVNHTWGKTLVEQTFELDLI